MNKTNSCYKIVLCLFWPFRSNIIVDDYHWEAFFLIGCRFISCESFLSTRLPLSSIIIGLRMVVDDWIPKAIWLV
jgi:hypothetical protein